MSKFIELGGQVKKLWPSRRKGEIDTQYDHKFYFSKKSHWSGQNKANKKPIACWRNH